MHPNAEPISEPKPRRRKKGLPWWVTALVFGAVATGFTGAIYNAYQPKNGLTVERFDIDARDRLTIGASTRDDVMAWYAAQGISDVSDTFDAGGKKVGYMAQVPNDSWMKQSQIQITFRFDNAGKLAYLSVFQERRE